MQLPANQNRSALRQHLARWLPPDRAAGRALRRAAVAALDMGGAITHLLRAPLDGFQLWRAWRWASHTIGERAEGDQVVMLVVSALRVDPRVRREARELADAGYRVTVIWPDNDSSAGEVIDWGEGIAFEPLPANAGRFAYSFPGFFGMTLVRAGRAHRPLAFHAHDLNTMLAALVLGRETGAHVVADHHEWFSEHVTWSSRRNDYLPQGRLSKAANRWLERLVLANATRVITVCRSIADAMALSGDGRSVAVIRNIPALLEVKMAPGASLRETLQVSSGQLLILYQGGVGPSRALEPVIRALRHAPEAVLAIRGPGIEHFAAHYRAVASDAGAANRLHLLPPVPQEQVVSAARGADCGLYTVADLCKSFTYALPNKAFEYLAAGLPVLTADYPEVRSLLVEGGAGLAFDPANPEDIAAAMRRMADHAIRARLAEAIPAILAANAPEAEWAKLSSLYAALPRRAR